MDTLTLGLVVAAALVHATWNLLAKRSTGGTLFIWSYSATVAVLYLPLVAWALADSQGDWTALAVLAVFASGVLHLGYSVALQTGYRKADLSIVYPVARGTGPAFSVAGAILLIGEPFTFATAVGAALVVAGVLIIGIGNALGHAAAVWPGIRWGTLTGLFIASYTVNDGWAVKLLGVSPIVVDYFGNLVRLTALTPMAVRRRSDLVAEFRKTKWTVLGVGILIPVPYILVLYAMTMAPISVIAPARELSMMVGVLFGWWLLKEADIARRLIGAALIAAGVTFLTYV